ncbi:MAG: TetR/AcrR family transcriptional regulator [Phyllobacterium sp.]|uniref:TetR/AcrR family transcriptional regulator n=1 Tax=Phyllobacterium sp. TaxID=1871046 RepID=UPI0030EFD3CF
MARLTREQSQAQTKAKLLASAREVVARDGYEGATVERIAEEAGFSKGAFYSNFHGKEDIFLYLLETHSGQDVTELQRLLGDIEDGQVLIDTLSNWAQDRSADPSWGMLALELFRRARRDATFGERHSNLFRAQWEGLGKILLRLFPEGKAPAGPATLGGIVFELTYGAASSFTNGPTVGELVKVSLTSMYMAYGLERETAS